MNYSFKLKVRQPNSAKEDLTVRRTRTDHVDALKRLTRQPLVENKKIANSNQSVTTNNPKPVKKTTLIKSVTNKSQHNYSRVVTEYSERPTYLPERPAHQHHQRTNTAGSKIGGGFEAPKPLYANIGSSFKKR